MNVQQTLTQDTCTNFLEQFLERVSGVLIGLNIA